MLGHSYEQVDYISLHSYYDNRANTRPASWRAPSTWTIHRRRHCHLRLRARQDGSPKVINLSFDEWNVWHTLGRGRGRPGSWRRG